MKNDCSCTNITKYDDHWQCILCRKQYIPKERINAFRSIREQYGNLINQKRELISANTVLDMIDAAVSYVEKEDG